MYKSEDKIGDYVLVSFLGRGQYGEVWLAEKQIHFSKRRVRHALKILFKNGDDEIDLKTASGEIDTWIEATGHPNVISVIDIVFDNDRTIIVSEYASGGSLKTWLQKNGGCAPREDDALKMMRGILRGIEHLHAKSIVHRDLKPDNILLQGDFPRITDFGISRIVSENMMATKAIGSPAYMSPESFDGDKSTQADIWAAGVILYEMLTGTYPFNSETIYGLYDAIRHTPITLLPESISQSGRAIVYRALEKDRSRRYRTATEMLRDIEDALYELSAAHRQLSADTTLPKAVITFDQPANSATGDNLRPDQTNEKYTGQTLGLSLPPSDVSAESSDLVFSNGRDRAKKLRPLWIFSGLAVGLFGLILFGGALLAIKGRLVPVLPMVGNDNHIPSVPDKPLKDDVPAVPPGMVYIPGGNFLMGRNDGISEAERPAHQITVKPFFIDINEVTNEKYFDYKQKNTTANTATYQPGEKNFPAVGVSWQEASNFCRTNGKRLPFEDEWEFAARGTGNFLYPWGNEWNPQQANVGNKKFAEVGSFQGKSPFGINDMAGNAWEWTASDFKAYPGGTLPEAFAQKGNLKTIRGGSFEATKEYATTTYRIGWAASGGTDYSRTGFRCVADINR